MLKKLILIICFIFTTSLCFGATKYYSGSGDGYTDRYDDSESSVGANWEITHNAESSNNGNNPSSSDILYVDTYLDNATGEGTYWATELQRAFIPINTSGIDDDAVIKSAVLNIYAVAASKMDEINDSYSYIAVVGETSQASTSEITWNDYDKCGSIDSPTVLSSNIDLTDITEGQYLQIPLNEAGIGLVNKTGYTMLGIRGGHDIEDVYTGVAEGHSANSEIVFYGSNYTGTDKDPYLEITIATPQAVINNAVIKNAVIR